MLPELEKLKQELELEFNLDQEELAFLEQVKTLADLENYTDDGSGAMCALAYDAALALGASREEAGRIARDPPEETETPPPDPPISIDHGMRFDYLPEGEPDEYPRPISTGLGIGGVGSDDHNMAILGDLPASEYDPRSKPPGSQVCPAGTTYGIAGRPGDRCHCGAPADWNPGAGQLLCPRHWDDY